MFEKMVIASELNLDMKNVVAPLVELQKMGAKECLILQCVKPQELNTDFRDMVLEWYKTNLDLERQMLLDLGFEVNNQLGEGHMRHEINRVAESEEASLIVVGSETTTVLGEVLWGGAAHEVIHHPVKPVLQIRVKSKTEESEQAPKVSLLNHILFPTDFSESAEKAFDVLVEMAEKGLEHVTLAHVTGFEEKVPLAEEIMGGLKETLIEKGVKKVDISVLIGNPTKELLSLIKMKDVTLVVMSTQGHGIIEDIFIGSVSHNLSRHSEASVLLIPSK